ncbi:hypothetical protein A3D11_00085 [Candidatus Peribacteria bacterium RIFCSPHIGHO2_02_FULL_49_16]|nr:MAG: hypothetical protein A2880_02200 [Candidatus Peribacteria bacterium RIFCSPHIGHO2_01_FULL_49_38]OGJ59999.1 MAG: hypothetical protein A3D11_00085 [Candidatus Peribacteria bacterium RIFCSPHIGHO2_02_FULL_49_16]
MHKALFLLTGLLTLSTLELSKLPDGDLHLHLLDVGQGDSILLTTPSGKHILIDGGPNLSVLEHLGTYLPFFDRHIDLLILSHPNQDHLTAFPEITKRYSIGSILLTGAPFDLARYDALITQIRERNIPVIVADPKKDIAMGDGVLIDVLWPPQKLRETFLNNENELSIIARILYKEHSILLTGDIEHGGEVAILQSGADSDSTILKVAHHGSKSSSSTGFLLAASPDLALISAGKNNPYGHPNKKVIERLEAMGIEVRSTIKDGTVSLILE